MSRTTDSGMEREMIRVLLMLLRNKKRMITARIPPIKAVFSTLIDRLFNKPGLVKHHVELKRFRFPLVVLLQFDQFCP